MSTSLTPPPFFLPSSSSLPLAKAAPGTAIRAPPASAAADPVRKPRREVSDAPPFSSRYVRSLMYRLSFSRMATVLAHLFIAADRSACPVPPSVSRAPPRASICSGRKLYHSISLRSTNVGATRITACLRYRQFFTCFQAILSPENYRAPTTSCHPLLSLRRGRRRSPRGQLSAEAGPWRRSHRRPCRRQPRNPRRGPHQDR